MGYTRSLDYSLPEDDQLGFRSLWLWARGYPENGSASDASAA